MEISFSPLCHTCCLIIMTCPRDLLASNGAVTTNSSPLAFSVEPKPTQPHCGPHPPSEMENTRSFPRRNMKAQRIIGRDQGTPVVAWLVGGDGREEKAAEQGGGGDRERPPQPAAQSTGRLHNRILRFKSVIVSLLVDWFI